MPRKRVLLKTIFLNLVIFLSLSQANIVSAGSNMWTTNGPAGESIFTLAINPVTPSTVYGGATDGGGVYISTNSGGSWSQTNTGLTDTKIYSLAVDPAAPANLYAGTFSAGVFKSTNGGGSWSAINNGLTAAEVVSLAVDPVTDTTLYAGSWGGGVFKSTNSGANWSAVNTGLTDLFVHDLAIDRNTPSTLFAGTLSSGVFKSTDGGGSWTTASTGLGELNIRDLAINPTTPATLYAGTYGDGVYKSEDGGGSWTAFNTGLAYSFILALAIDPATPTTIYAGTIGGVYVSTNGGGNWFGLNTNLSNSWINALAINPTTPTTLYAGSDGGGIYVLQQTPPSGFSKYQPTSGSAVTTSPTLTWWASDNANHYEYCFDTSNNNTCDTSWISRGFTVAFAELSGLANNTTYYWQVRSVNPAGYAYADGGTWWSFKTPIFADVPIDHQFWAYIEAMYNSGVTTGCGVSPLIYCPDNTVTRAAMAVFLLRAKYGADYAPPAASHFFSDLPVAGKEWQEAWVDELYREGITGGCGTDPLIFCPESSVTRAAMAVFILRSLEGSSYAPPAASHFFSDMPTAGKEWMEPFVDEFYRRGITTGCGMGPLIYCPETAVKRGAMAAFIVRAFNLPLP